MLSPLEIETKRIDVIGDNKRKLIYVISIGD